MNEDKYWELQDGDLIVVDTEEGEKLVEFVSHLYDGAFFYRLPKTYLQIVATRDQIIR